MMIIYVSLLLLLLTNASRVLKQKVKADRVADSHNDHSYSSEKRTKSTLDCFENRFFLNAPAKRVLSYGCANGIEVWALRLRFPKAQIVGTDLKFAHNATMMQLAREQYGGNGTFATIEQAATLGPFDLIVCHFVLYEHMTELHVEQFFHGLVTNFLAHDGVIEIAAVIGQNDKLARFPFLEHNARGAKHLKLDARVILEWLRVRSVAMTDAVARANAEQQRTGLLPPRHFNDKLELIRRCLYRSSNHDFVTLDVGDGRSLRGGRVLQVVFSPHAPLVRKPYDETWQRYYERCRWNFVPNDIWEFPSRDGGASGELRNATDLQGPHSRIFIEQCG
jgi:trans-aconitate methyltransferase